jgi:rfaE bifunctional protein kinase chain/domain
MSGTAGGGNASGLQERVLPVDCLSEARLEVLLTAVASLRIGVVGDLALDAYWYADMTLSHLSRETPHFPRPIVRETYSPGAGANVADNLVALGVGGVPVLSVLGEDWRGERLRQVMAERGIETGPVLFSSERSTTTYIKPILEGYDSQQEDARIDFENARPLTAGLEAQLIEGLAREIAALDALIVADQLDVNGVITPRVREALNTLAGDTEDIVVVVDSRQHIGRFRHMVLKPNWAEAMAVTAPGLDPRKAGPDAICESGLTLSQRSGRPVFVTRSAEGVMVCEAGRCRPIAAGPVQPPLDPVGAGDTFIAALTASLAAGASPSEAGAVANLAASITVEKLNITGTASPDELRARYALASEGGESL